MKNIVLLVFLGISVMMDCEKDQIPNWLCIMGAATGLWYRWYENAGLGMVGFGCLFLLGTLIPLWILHILGGGDVKLLLMTACYLGMQVKELLILSGLCSAVYGIIVLMVRQNAGRRFGLFFAYCRNCVTEHILKPYPFDKTNLEDKKNGGIHLTYPIFAGYAIGFMTGVLLR
jgi:Flp pilus assembly protein protease CpaA